MKSLLRNGIMSSFLGWIIWLYMALCNRTIRWTVEGEEDALKLWLEHPNMIIAAWHSTILLLPSGWNRIIRRWPQQKKPTAMLISLSKDGEPVAKAIKHLGLQAVRGSSNNKKKSHNKGGMKALSEALGILKDGGGVCITPDGPRGPAEKAQNGPIIMALRSQAPILPYAIVSAPAKRLQTWDKFRIPRPFTRGAVVFGQAIIPDKAIDRETLRQQLEDNLNTATRRAEELSNPQKKDRP